MAVVELIIRSLIDNGAYVSGRNEDGKTPVHIAAEHNNIIAAEILLESGSKISPNDSEGQTPLDLAESSEMIKLLKSYGASE